MDFFIKSGYYIVPSSSTALQETEGGVEKESKNVCSMKINEIC
jgi:hypothetical protein